MDLMFRDQSEEVASKARGIKAKAKPKHPVLKHNATPDCREVSRKSMDSDISAASESLQVWCSTLQVSAEEQAVCFFFRNYAPELSRPSKNMFDYLPAFYNNDNRNTALSCAVTALGLAGLSYRRNESCLLSAAKSMYSWALHLTNEALRNPATAVNDTTLVSVLLLGLYETNTCEAPPSMRAWLKHINGAAMLLELRGRNQFSTEIGRRLFTQVRTQVVNFCILTRRPVPSVILELSAQQLETGDGCSVDQAAKVTPINARFCNLRAEIGAYPPSSSSISTEAIISEALSIAAELQDWHSDLPSTYCPTSTMKIYSPTPDVYADYYHIYSDMATAALLSHYRTVLILVHEIILTQLSFVRHPSPGEYDQQHGYSRNSSPSYLDQVQRQTKASQKAIFNLIDLICASVPFSLGYDHCSVPAAAHSEPLLPRAAGGNAIIWPLYVAGQIAFVRNSTRAWIIGRLNKIGAEMGVHQATVMARFLLQRKEVTDVFVDEDGEDEEGAMTEE